MEGVSSELTVLLMFLAASVLVAVVLTLQRGLNIRAVVSFFAMGSRAALPSERDARHVSAGPPVFALRCRTLESRRTCAEPTWTCRELASPRARATAQLASR